MRLKALLTYIIVTVLLHIQSGWSEAYLYTRYTSENGLCNNHVHDIVQDTDGFIWIGTHYGISRFDGQRFTNFLQEDYPSMQRNDIYHTFLIEKGDVAFAGSKGTITYYNKDKDVFNAIPIGDSILYDDITGFCLSEGESIITTSKGIYALNKTTNRYAQILPVMNESHTLEAIKDKYGRYWIGTFNGVTVMNGDGQVDEDLACLKNLGQMVNNIVALSEEKWLLCSSIGSTWMVTLSNKGKLINIDKINTPFKGISEVMVDSDGTIWIGTSGSGLWNITLSNENFNFNKITPPVIYQNETEKITALTKDRQGNIWIGTQSSGLFKIRKVSSIGNLSSSDIGLNKMCGSAFCETSNGDLFFGTDGQGIFVLDSSYLIKKHITIADGLPCNNILSMQQTHLGIACSFWGGEIIYLDPVTYAIHRETYPDLNKPSNMIKNLLVDNKQRLWACTAGDGIYQGSCNGSWKRIPLENQQLMDSHPDLWINQVKQAPNGSIWIISSRTIWMSHGDRMEPLFPDIDNVPSHNPLQMYAGAHNAKGDFFVASNKGIIHFSADGKKHDFLDFIPTGSYKSIDITSDGTIWTSGSNGILSIQYEKQEYEQQRIEIKDRDFFTACASYISADHKIYFGNNDGFICIQNHQSDDFTDPTILWDELYIQGEKVKPGTNTLPLPLHNTNHLELSHAQTNIKLSFNIIDFSNQESYLSQYRIVPLDEEWTSLEHNREIAINHLSAGDYTIEIQFKKNHIPVNKTLTLDITVTPPWWFSWWFSIICALLFISLIALFIYIRFRNINKQKKILEKMVKERTVELKNANQSLQEQKKEIAEQNEILLHTLKDKDRLISIVAHDLKNPMFAIVCTLDDIIKRKRKKQDTEGNMLSSVYQSALSLQHEMINLLNWATNKEQEPEILIREINVLEIVQEVTSLLNNMALKKQIEIVINHQLSHLSIADARMVSTIIKNILSNAIKFSLPGQLIHINLSEKNHETWVEIKDSGRGMSQEQLDQLIAGTLKSTNGTQNETGHGLGFKIIKEFVEKNNGSLQINSQLGQGTSLIFSLPLSDTILPQQESDTQRKTKGENNINIDTTLLKDKSILIVDDDPLLLLHLKKTLEPYVSVHLASDGLEGLEKAKDVMPDLTISDIDMPQMDGLEMYEQMRTNRLTSHIPLLFISANNNDDMRLCGLSSGAIDYITKPFDDQELIIKICNFLTAIKKQQIQFMIESQSDNISNSTEPNPLLKQLLNIIKENYSNPDLSFEEIARLLGMSKSTLFRRLKSLTDKTPMEILSDYRLSEAKKLLEKQQANVSEVAYRVGFNDPQYFSKKFKETFGISPSKL